MKENDKLLTVLYLLLVDELAAVNRHYDICVNHESCMLLIPVRNKGKNEMQDAEWLIDRIVLLVDSSATSNLNTIRIGKAVSEIIMKLPN